MTEDFPEQTTDVTTARIDVSDEMRQRVLRQRAQMLASSFSDPDQQRMMRILEFAVGEERYAFKTDLLDEVYPLRDLAPLPGTPGFVLGITSVRGRILSVLDLQVLFGGARADRDDSHPIVVLRSVAMEFAIAADSVSEVREIPEDSVQRPLSSTDSLRDEYLLGLTIDGVTVLDAQRMLADPRLVIADPTSTAPPTKGSTK